MNVDRCVPLWYNYITLLQGLERCRVKNIQQSWVWPCEAIGRKPNYDVSLTFGPMSHIDVIATHLLFSPLKRTKYQI